MTRERERETFLLEIKESPRDMALRGIFADFLDEYFDEPELATFHREMTVEKYDAAIALLERLADECERPLSKVIEAMEEAVATGGSTLFIGHDTPDMAYEQREELWDSYAIVSGCPVPEDQRQNGFISCAC